MDEAGAAQQLLPKSRRKKTITVKDVEAIVASIARIPERQVSQDDKSTLQYLGRNLKTMVFGQDKAIDVLANAIKLSRRGCALLKNRLVAIYFQDQQGRQNRSRETARPLDGHQIIAL